MTPTELLALYDEIWLHDFEFVARPGEHPDVVCLVAHELRSGRTLRLWRDELGEQPPYRTDSGVLFVSFVANAECACHLALGWPLPKNVLDLSPAFRNLVNGRHSPEGKGLIGALRYYGFPSIGQKQKDAMRDRILRGWPFSPEEQKQIIAYCATDMDALRLLLARMLPEIDLAVALHHGEFAAAAALMEHRGIPMDMEKLSLLQDEKTWSAVRDAMVPALDARYRVYVRNAAGDWTCSEQRFAAMLEREGITGWPQLESGKLNMKEKTIKDMAKGRPVLEPFRQLRYTRNKMRKVKLAVGRDGRNRTVLWPFQAKTSRTQPKASQWIFSPAVWLRSLIKPTPEMAVAHIDYACAEFMIGAVLSDGHLGPVNNMRDLYLSGDPYLTFAKRVGAVPDDCTGVASSTGIRRKDSHQIERHAHDCHRRSQRSTRGGDAQAREDRRALGGADRGTKRRRLRWSAGWIRVSVFVRSAGPPSGCQRVERGNRELVPHGRVIYARNRSRQRRSQEMSVRALRRVAHQDGLARLNTLYAALCSIGMTWKTFFNPF